ncbi:hypothetical protein M0805_005511 [Coniferiporia weirii]|nr:hypothetical protein M0805_005511 [Coniferiporia weirii]
MPQHSHHANTSNTLFQNPWETPEESDENIPPSSSVTSWLWGLPALLSSIPIEWARENTGYKHPLTEVVKPDFQKFAANKHTLKATWLGHASYIVEFPQPKESEKPLLALFDPVFSDRVGPSPWAGIRRRLPPPCLISELPEFHFVVISHNHYDHLDLPSIREIARLRGPNVTFLVPLGVKYLLTSSGISGDQVHELDWWDEVSLPAAGSGVAAPTLSFTCVPAQHTSGRSVLDKCTSLWCGWVVKQLNSPLESSTRIYHAGDTGYIGSNGACPVFEEIGERCGPFDLAMLPIWRGGTLSFISQLGLRLTHHPLLSAMHASPVDAVAIHRAVRARHTLAMHFATFAGSDAEALEPVVELMEAREEAGVGDWMEEGGMGVIGVGSTVEVEPVAGEHR